MIKTRAITDWATGLGLTVHGKPVPWKPGPEQLEFDENDLSATITKVPGGGGLVDEGTADDLQVFVLVRHSREKLDEVEDLMDRFDRAMIDVKGLAWGSYVQFVDRPGGSPVPDFDSPERITWGVNYQIREGREYGG